MSPKPALVFGILPYASPVALFRRFTPLAHYLSGKLNRAVIIETARDFPTFIKRTADGRYDILMTAPHLVLLALDSKEYDLCATYIKPLSAAVVVQRNSAIHKLKGLAGKTVAVPPAMAIVTIVGRRYLKDAGLTGARAPVYQTYRSHNAAYHAVLGGEAAAAVISIFVARRAIEQKQPLRILARSQPFPALGILVAKRLPLGLREEIAQDFIDMGKSKQGRKVLHKIALPGYRAVNPSEFSPLRRYLTK